MLLAQADNIHCLAALWYVVGVLPVPVAFCTAYPTVGMTSTLLRALRSSSLRAVGAALLSSSAAFLRGNAAEFFCSSTRKKRRFHKHSFAEVSIYARSNLTYTTKKPAQSIFFSHSVPAAVLARIVRGLPANIPGSLYTPSTAGRIFSISNQSMRATDMGSGFLKTNKINTSRWQLARCYDAMPQAASKYSCASPAPTIMLLLSL